MAMNKKTTLVIDHEAEQKAKQQAMERELAGDQPAKKTEIIKDNSVETNKSELKKIKSWTAKSVLIVAGVCALIGLIVWSVLYKTHLDKKAAEEAKRKKAEAVAVEKAEKLMTPGELDDKDCDAKKDADAIKACKDKKQVDLINNLINDKNNNLPNEKASRLFETKIQIILNNSEPANRRSELNKLFEELKKHNADHRAFATLGGAYIRYDKKQAIEAYKIAKQKYNEAAKQKDFLDLDVYAYPENEEELNYLLRQGERD